MTRWRPALAALIVLVPAWLAVPAAAQAPPRSGNAVFDRAVELVNEHFFAPSELPQFNEAASLAAAQMPGLKDAAPGVIGDAVSFVLDSLHASHTGWFTPDQVDYYELADVFRFALRGDMRRLFPPRGEVTYAGIGIASARIDGKSFVTRLYDGGPAAKAGLLTGDEIVTVDGAPFAEVGSFRGKAGGTAHLAVRRAAGADPIAIDVPVADIQPGDFFVKAISDSVRRLDQGGKRIGFIRLWAYTRDDVTQILYDELGNGRLKDVDGLVLDLRSKWGGAPGDAAETFVGRAAGMVGVNRDGTRNIVTLRWAKPVVAIIDGGTRSGMEVLAYSLKKNGVPMVGVPTAGDVLAGTAYLLPDDSLLELAVADVLVDGQRLEANPVAPDVAVPFDVRYAAGHDPQLDAATALLAERLGQGGGVN
jgi:C-terminal processing protease CtpA/Prc